MRILSQKVISGLLQPQNVYKFSKNGIFERALLFVFNRVSKSRVDLVGPDRACAEWLMRNGALVKWKGYNSYITHYNGLPLDSNDRGVYHIEEVDGTNAAISHHGFPHFAGCNHVKKIKLVQASYIDDLALCQLNLLNKSLVELEISECPEVTFKGLKCLTELENLKHLKIGELPNVKDEEINDLMKLLPKNCDLVREQVEVEKK
ncbi:hypothetical protein LSTR_LSTR013915 [Laodelphax striatellus]|uniref:Uncharacterized protein n=1 Tax=Laodelphax striatellus TaxID=195883 RepID=A0A482X3Z6_LAOST|nr:hypothetical protein LSTR_LSTR013915 [Laodelphax striatellus]